MRSRPGQFLGVALVSLCAISAPTTAIPPLTDADEPAPPVVEGRWVRPADTSGPAVPEWGHAKGLRIGLAPLPGPRGLLRVYVPELGHASPKVINFIAVEPIPKEAPHRGYSELEHSRLDGIPGKRFWCPRDASDPEPADADRPGRGAVELIDGVEQLSVPVRIERFENGAEVRLHLLFRADRPTEVGISVFTAERSVPLESCVITATMGNYARLRTLELAGETLHAGALWPDYRGDGFTPQVTRGLERLQRRENGDAFVSAIPSEPDPGAIELLPGTSPGWRYRGPVLRQSWRMSDPPAGLRVSVNGRFTYWASQSPIPGGVAFENFELIAPFVPGQTFWFGVDRVDPAGPTQTPGSRPPLP